MLGSEGLGLGSIGTAAEQGAGDDSKDDTLAKVYAAGVSSPLTDDLMAMLHGTVMRFQATDNPESLPYQATFDAAAGAGTYGPSGLPAAAWSLATTAGGFGRVFQGYQQFDTGWDGIFSHIGTQGIFRIESCNYKQAPSTTTWDDTVPLATRDYNPGGRWPQMYPFPPDPTATASMVHEVSLYNTIAGDPVLVHQQDGWGQVLYGMWPPLHGITWQWATHAKWDNAGGTEIGDGVGWGVFEHDLDHPTNNPRGGLTCKAQDLVGNWVWSFLVSDDAGGLESVADFSKSGISLNAPITSQGTSSSYTSALIDLTVPADNISINIPQRPGFMFFRISASLVLHDIVGTATSALTGGVGNDVNRTNLCVINTSAATINATAPLVPFLAALGGPSTANADSSTQIVAKITAAPAGVTSMHGYIELNGFWVPS